MTSSISWIDPAGLEATLARIGLHGRRPTGTVHRPGAVAVDAPSQTAVPTSVEPSVIPEFLPPDGPLRRRLEAFITWLIEASGSNVAFIVDRDGLPLVNRQADPDLLAIASSVMRLVASINAKLKLLSPVGGAVTLELEEKQLMLIAVETPIGIYIVGQVGDLPLGRHLRRAASEALRRAFQPSPESEAVSS
jgi:hypothetical protein